MIHRKKITSLNAKLMVIAFTAFFPMLLVLIYSLWNLYSSTEVYSKITESITYANQTMDFKERMDYSMYLAVVRKRDYQSLGDGETTVNGIKTVNPYEFIDQMVSDCSKLSNMSTVDINKNQIIRLNNTLASLYQKVQTMEDMIHNTGNYEDNMIYLEENIYMLTTMIRSGIEDYIQVETSHLNEIRIKQKDINQRVCTWSITVAMLVISVVLLFTFRAFQSVTKPIRRLCELTQKVAEGDFSVKSRETDIEEISVLSNSFNHMTNKIGTLINDIKEKEQNLHIMETKLLQAQINPHFLYNTLDTIVWLAESKRNEEAVAMVTGLSQFFRTTLCQGRDFITVKEEQSHIESYLKIQQFRYQDIMDYEIMMEDSILDYVIPKLLLQPLVENALYHGVKNKRGKSKIFVQGQIQGECLVFKVIDNGRGMTHEQLLNLQQSIKNTQSKKKNDSFGLVNIHQRIQHYYGEEYGLHLDSKENCGTEAKIILSAKKNQFIS